MAGALALSGCFTVRSAITINDDDTVDVSVAQLIDVERLGSIAAMFGEDVSELTDASGGELIEEVTEGDDACEGLVDQFGDRVTSSEISEGNSRGVECRVSGIALADFTSFGDDDSSIAIVRGADTTSIEMTLGGLAELTDPDETEFFETLGFSFDELFDVSFAVTAPGSVVTSNATSVDGSTATWKIAPGAGFIEGDRAVMTAEWSGTGTSNGGLSTWLLVLVAAIAAAVVAAVIIAGRRKTPGDTGSAPPASLTSDLPAPPQST
jgi:hypothetical protein